jgi:hypothetical protein
MSGNEKIFNITLIAPIGFITNKYPVKNCAVCRNELILMCHACKNIKSNNPYNDNRSFIEDSSDNDCTVETIKENNDFIYVHKHCKSYLSDHNNLLIIMIK